MKKLKRTYTRCALTASLVMLVLLVAGSIWDLPISKFLYPGHESSLGQFFSALPMAVALLVTVFIDALTAFALLFLTRECQTKTILRFVCTVIVVCVGIMLLINIIKVPWGRARMRLIYATGNDTYFSNWWQAGTALKKKLVADGVASDEFRSFPSGHTACHQFEK